MNVSIVRRGGAGALSSKERAGKLRPASTRPGGASGDVRVQAGRKAGASSAPLAGESASHERNVGLRRREAALSLALALTAAPGSASAKVPSGYSPVKNTQKGYAFLYPFGWQEVSVDGAEVTYKDIIEPLESISLEILPTNKASIEEFGDVDSLAQTLVKQVLVPPSQEGALLKSSKVSGEGGKESEKTPAPPSGLPFLPRCAKR